MKRAVAAVATSAVLLALSGCPGPRSERWEEQIESWPEDRPTGGTPTEFLEYVEAEESFEETMAAESAGAEH